MTGSIMMYGLALGVLLAGAAHFLDGGLRAIRIPTRGIWLLAMAAVTAAPLIPRNDPALPTGPALGQTFAEPAIPHGLEAAPSAWHLAIPTLPQYTDGPLTILWVASTVLVLLALGWTWRRIRRSSASWARKTLRGREILLSHQLGPAVLGIFRPAIVLPSWILDLDPEKLDMILMHEESHVKSWDPAVLALGILMVAMTPWNPAIWWMLRRLHLAVEADCDRRVLSNGVPPRAYGTLLLDVAAGARRLSILSPALVEGGPSSLERRLLMIHSTVGRRGAFSALLALTVSALLIVLACETPTPPAAEDPDGLEQTLAVPAEVAQEGEGYFLVRKVGDQVEYVRSVPASELDRLEGEKVRPETDPAFVVQEVTTEAAEDAGSVIRLREQPGTDGEGDPIQPLIIVDGVITHSSLAEIESEDIKSIEVVKGGAAEALYGARAAGGVVLITTKKGGNAP